MPARAASTPTENPVLRKGRKSTQRERLLAGMVMTGNRDGYAGANVSKIIAEAGVSRPTFYDYFSDKDDCFLQALGDIQERLLLAIRAQVADGPPAKALQASIGALLQFASVEREQALFLTSGAMSAGPPALDARDRGIAEIARVIDEALAPLPPSTLVADLSPLVVIGGVHRLLASRLRRGELGINRLGEELDSWINSYERALSEGRWRDLEPSSIAPPSAGLALGPLPAPSPLGPGRPGVSKEDVAANHRARILYAAAQLAESKGYNATTIANITRLAGVDGRAFYAAFADKQDAFMAVHELGVQQVMGATASAFFTGASWPERVWEAGRALTGFLENNPMIAHVGFVEAYAVGPGAVQRVEDSHVTFMIFLQEGYTQKPPRVPPSRVALELIVTTIFEIIYREERRADDPSLSGMIGHMGYLALAPFLGASEANEFVLERLAAQRPRSSES